MSQSANIRSIEALSELQGSLTRYQSFAHEALLAIEIEILRTREWLQKQLDSWQKELRRREELLKQAMEALRSCEAQARRDPETGRTYIPDCSRQQVAVRQAKQRVDEAIIEWQTVQYHIKRVDDAASTYHTQSNRLKEALQSDLLKGVALLSHSKGILDSYTGAAGNMSSSTIPSNTPMPSVPIAGKIGDTELQMVSIADIDLSDMHNYVTGQDDFRKGVSPERMAEGLHKMQSIVLPAVARGEGRDYFFQLDTAQGLENADGYSNIYDIYLKKDSCIHLENVDGKFRVLNGFHRLFVAQNLGITHIPALVDSSLP